MKATKYITWIGALLLLLAGAGCGKEKEDVPVVVDQDTISTRPDTGALRPHDDNRLNSFPPSEILGTWKLIGFGDAIGNTFREVEPKDCKMCYTITFRRDGIFTAISSENMIWGSFQVINARINVGNWSELGIDESNEGKSYVAAIRKMTRYEATLKQLRLYDEAGRRFLLFAESETRDESEAQRNQILDHILCRAPMRRDRTCAIVGKWKQAMVYDKEDSTDCSCHDLIYEFHDDGTLIVSGESEMGQSYPPVLGTYRYTYSEISDCPTCLPAPNLSIIDAWGKPTRLFCFVGISTMDIKRLNKPDAILGTYNRIYIRTN